MASAPRGLWFCNALLASVAGGAGASAVEAPEVPASELDECVANLPECLAALVAANHTGGASTEEELLFGVLGSWMKGLYVREESPRLAEDLAFRSSTLQRLRELAAQSLSWPSLSIGVGQMLFLYFWWGEQPPPSAWESNSSRDSGPDLWVVAAAAELHARSISFVGCDAAATSLEHFETKKCTWRWRFLLMLLVELGRKLAFSACDLVGGARHLRMAEQELSRMRSMPFFAQRQPWHRGAYFTNHNEDFLPQAKHLPVWPREMWPSLPHYLEEHAHIFLAELLRLLEADQAYDELFVKVQVQQTEFTPLPRDWGLLDLVRSGNATALCQYAPTSCSLLQDRPELNGRCHSERVPNAGVGFARLLPGAEIKPHFATEPRIAVHLGLITPPGPEMMVANERVTWSAGQAVVFDDTFVHSVRHTGSEPRFVLLAWICHPCDVEWRSGNGDAWLASNPLPKWCGS